MTSLEKKLVNLKIMNPLKLFYEKAKNLIIGENQGKTKKAVLANFLNVCHAKFI